MDFKDMLNESGLARIWEHMEKHDVGIVTASRYARECSLGQPYTKKENQQRNKSLLSKLKNKRYGVTSAKGSFIENEKSKNPIEVGEKVFFVVDQQDTGGLLKDLKKLGEEFEQDSILYIPKAKAKAELHGTNHCKTNELKYGEVSVFEKRTLGTKGKFFTRVKGRPFVFESESVEDHILPEGFFGRMGCDVIAKKHWSEIKID